MREEEFRTSVPDPHKPSKTGQDTRPEEPGPMPPRDGGHSGPTPEDPNPLNSEGDQEWVEKGHQTYPDDY
jgi:hypothetical protein